ncbi:MAG: phosphate acetyltransferase [Spirochaetia bacterium]|nr:phosphate acetyltransferase [Spirochaetia bacterium]
MGFIDRMKAEALKNQKKLVLPEGTDSRIIKAAKILADDGLVSEVWLVGDQDEVAKAAKANDVKIAGRIMVADPAKSSLIEAYANEYYELRKAKGMTLENALKEMQNPLYYGAMMVRKGDADAMVAGAVNTTGAVASAALKVIKTAPGIKTASSCFIMEKEGTDWGYQGSYILADCAVIIEPDANQLADIVLAAADSCRSFLLTEPKIAMLSFSSKGSAKHETVDKVTQALEIVKQKDPTLKVDGELQLDAAIIPEVGARKAPGSPVAGSPNTLIFPNINAGNIGYKLMQRFGGFEAYGPIFQGFAKPVSDLSRGCSATDVVYTALGTINKK